MTRGQVIVGLCVVAVTLTGCSGSSGPPVKVVASSQSPSVTPSPTPTGLTLHPIVEIRRGPAYAPNYVVTKNGCRGANGLNDVRKGLAVTLYKANGDVVGTGFVMKSFVLAGKCYLVADVPDVDPEAFYQVQFGDRNKLAFSRKEIEAKTAVTIFG